MSYYFIANILITDSVEYQKYIERVRLMFPKYKGEYLAVDNTPEILEGNWDYTRLVLIRFSNKEDFEEWYYSDEYQEIKKYRIHASEGDSLLVKGLET